MTTMGSEVRAVSVPAVRWFALTEAQRRALAEVVVTYQGIPWPSRPRTRLAVGAGWGMTVWAADEAAVSGAVQSVMSGSAGAVAAFRRWAAGTG